MSEPVTELCKKHRAVVPLERHGGNVCPWCGGPTRKRKRATPKPRRQYRRLTDDQVRAAHRIYTNSNLSLRALGELLHERFGYANGQSAANALHRAFKTMGLPLRDRLEATIAANTRTPAQRREAEERRRARRSLNPTCAGIRTRYPGKGEPCSRAAMDGSEFCHSHDPERAAERARHLEDARSWIGL